MRRFYTFLLVIFLVLLQGSFFPVFVPRLPVNLVFVFFIILSFTEPRSWLLGFALTAGLAQDILYGEFVGLYAMAYYLSLSLVREFRPDLLEERAYTCVLRLVAATLIVDGLIGFVFYVSGHDPARLLTTLQLNAGYNLLSNLVLLGLVFGIAKLKNRHAVSKLLGASS